MPKQTIKLLPLVVWNHVVMFMTPCLIVLLCFIAFSFCAVKVLILISISFVMNNKQKIEVFVLLPSDSDNFERLRLSMFSGKRSIDQSIKNTQLINLLVVVVVLVWCDNIWPIVSFLFDQKVSPLSRLSWTCHLKGFFFYSISSVEAFAAVSFGPQRMSSPYLIASAWLHTILKLLSRFFAHSQFSYLFSLRMVSWMYRLVVSHLCKFN